MAKRPVSAGIDVSKSTLNIAVFEGNEGVFDNDAVGHKKLHRWLKKQARRAPIKAVLESTGNYGLDVALMLHAQKKVEVFYVNPMAAKGYATAGMVRAKTDRVDARVLAEMAENSRKAEPWTPPPAHCRELRALTRRVRGLVENRTREKNRLKAVQTTKTTPALVIEDIEGNIVDLTKRIRKLRKAAVRLILQHEDLSDAFKLLTSVKGVGKASGAEILGELSCMPTDLTVKQLVAQAGLDPRARQSGTKDGKRHISKMGSRYLRAALHMAAVTAVRDCPEVTRFYDILRNGRNKPYKVAMVAVSRKLLHCIFGMLKHRQKWDATKFYNPCMETPKPIGQGATVYQLST